MSEGRSGCLTVALLLLGAARLAAQATLFYPTGSPERTPVLRDDQGNILAIADDGPPHGEPRHWWFVGAEVGVVQPSFTRLATTREGEAFTFLGKTRSFDFDWGAAPEAELSYRFDGGEMFRIAYRGLASTGRRESNRLSAESSYPLLFGQLLGAGLYAYPTAPMSREMTGRLDEHWLDLDYVSPDYDLGAGRWRWSGGARLASLFADFRVRDDFPLTIARASDPGRSLSGIPFTIRQYASHHSYGVGGHLGLESAFPLGDTGLSLFGKADGGVLGAGNRQTFGLEAQATLPGGTTSPHGTSGTATGPGVIPTLNLQTGLEWSAPLGGARLSLSGGYELEGWWFIATGDHKSAGALFTHIDELSHGPFARLRLDF